MWLWKREERVRLEDTVRAFDGYLARTGRAESTRAKYLKALEPFAGWLGKRTPGSLGNADLDAHLKWWYDSFEDRRGRKPAPATYRAQITALKAFFDYLERSDLLHDGAGKVAQNRMALVEAPKLAAKPIDWLSQSEDEALLAHVGTPNEEILVWLLRHTGLRVAEARSLAIGDVDLTYGGESLRVLVSKTPAGQRTIPLAPELIPKLAAWFERLDTQGLYHPDRPVLATKNGTAMYESYIWRAVKRAAFKAGVRPVPCTCGAPTSAYHAHDCPRTASGEHLSEIMPHTLRRTFGSYLINKGMSIEGVSKLLGHTSVAVTQKYYAELLDETVRCDYLKALGYTRPRRGLAELQERHAG